MTLIRRRRFGQLSLALALAGLGTLALPNAAHAHDGSRSGLVFTSSNADAGNELLVYARGPDGALGLHQRAATGGQGSGAGLGSQGAVTLSRDGRFVFVVNALSHTVSTFALGEHAVQLISVVDSGGLHPISVTEFDGTVYVLNDGGAGNVAGFRNRQGELEPMAGSVRGLSAAGGTAPAQVGFSDDGDTLVVTEKAANKVTSYRVAADGRIGAPTVTASPGLTPFGFAFNRRNRLLVTEAVGGASGASTVSSFRFSPAHPARPLLVSAAVPDTQTAACWIAITPDGRYAFVTNTGSSSVSSYRIAGNGRLELTAAVAGFTGGGSAPADAAISADGRHLYVRNGRTFTLSAFDIDVDGSLVAAPTTDGLPTSAVGLAAN